MKKDPSGKGSSCALSHLWCISWGAITYAGPLRDWLQTQGPGSLPILDEAHNAAPASGSRYAIDSRFTRVMRELTQEFEHRLFLSATPHNGHSNSFSALLEMLDPQLFCRAGGVVVLIRMTTEKKAGRFCRPTFCNYQVISGLS
jgi:hypothetical protein